MLVSCHLTRSRSYLDFVTYKRCLCISRYYIDDTWQINELEIMYGASSEGGRICLWREYSPSGHQSQQPRQSRILAQPGRWWRRNTVRDCRQWHSLLFAVASK